MLFLMLAVQDLKKEIEIRESNDISLSDSLSLSENIRDRFFIDYTC